MRKAIAILYSPNGKRFYEAYGPMVTQKRKATRFVSTAIAEGAVLNRFGGGMQGFWNSEREHFAKAFIEYRGWKYEVQEVTP